jgi:hypothetical protein
MKLSASFLREASNEPQVATLYPRKYKLEILSHALCMILDSAPPSPFSRGKKINTKHGPK